MNKCSCRRWLDKAAEKALIERTRRHNLLLSAISLSYNGGAEPFTVKKLLGHSGVLGRTQTYAHMQAEALRRTAGARPEGRIPQVVSREQELDRSRWHVPVLCSEPLWTQMLVEGSSVTGTSQKVQTPTGDPASARYTPSGPATSRTDARVPSRNTVIPLHPDSQAFR